MVAREHLPLAGPCHKRRGFTLIELVVVIVVVGIIAIVVLPRFGDQRTFETRGFADEALAAVQFARKTAVASRRNVCAIVSGSTLSLTMATLAGSAQACSTSVINPAGGNYVVSPRHADVVFSGSFNVTFDGQGRPSAGASITIAGDTNYTLSVAAGTGYANVQ